MADFDLTQTDAQVQSILNDAQDAMGAGAQTSLTTDYIMLKGTNGRYHKILKDSFTEAVRNTLAGLLVNNDKGTTISQIAAIASDDFGSVTPANLASVLGEASFLTFDNVPENPTNELDDIRGIKAINWNTVIPYKGTSIILSFNGSFLPGYFERGVQIRLYNQNVSSNPTTVKYRVRWGNSGWSGWMDI